MEKKTIATEAGTNNKSDKTTDLHILTLKNNLLLRNWVHFLNDFLYLAGPEGLGKKTSKFGLKAT
ncbi:MAG: hypothetical protein ACREAS_01760 [Nitrososphaera sp.]